MIQMADENCRANNLRALIKHRWLKNLILLTESGKIQSARDQKKTWKYIDNWLELSDRLEIAKEFSEVMIDGFSPLLLVGKLTPFFKLTDTKKKEIKEAVHIAYLQKTGIVDKYELYIAQLNNLERDINDLKVKWSSDNADIRDAFDALKTNAKALLVIVEQLPEGIVLP